MTYKLYKKLQILFFLLFIPAIFLNQVGDKLSWLMQHRLLATIIFYAYPVLSLSLLYFGIYARTCKIKTAQKIHGPVALIILGSLFTLMSFGRPIGGFLMIHNAKIEPLTTARLQTIRATALDLNKRREERFAAVKFVYTQTGESIEYFDENGNRILYSPSETVKNERKEHIQTKQDVDRMVSLSKRIAFNLIIFAVISFLGFLMLLRYKSSRKGTEGPDMRNPRNPGRC